MVPAQPVVRLNAPAGLAADVSSALYLSESRGAARSNTGQNWFNLGTVSGCHSRAIPLLAGEWSFLRALTL